MKKAKIFILSFLCIFFAACDKLPENGDLDGLWQLMEISNAGINKDTKDQRLYCSFQLKLFMLGGNGEGSRAFFGRFERNDKTLRFYSFTFRSDYSATNQSTDKLMTEEDLPVISPWGFYSTDCTFDVVKLDNDQLVLEHEGLVLRYRKI